MKMNVKINTKPVDNFHTYVDEYGQMIYMEEVKPEQKNPRSKKDGQKVA